MALRIEPNVVEIARGESVSFRAVLDDHEVSARWSVPPAYAKDWDDKSKTFSPTTWNSFSFFGRRVAIHAAYEPDREAAGSAETEVTIPSPIESACADVWVTPRRLWIVLLTGYLLICGGVTVGGIFCYWTAAEFEVPDAVVIGPAQVAMATNSTTVFSANRAVAWQFNQDPQDTGSFTAEKVGTYLFTGVASDGSRETAKIVVDSGPGKLSVEPPWKVLRSGDRARFEVMDTSSPDTESTLSWRIDLAAGSTLSGFNLSSDSGPTTELTINDEEIESPARLVLTVERAATVASLDSGQAAIPARKASASILVTANAKTPKQADADRLALIMLALFAGAFGGLIHGVNSLVGYVGSHKFGVSWAGYYLARPFLGAGIAFLTVMLFRSGLDPSANADLSGRLTILAFAGIAGLFSDKAMLKLKQIADVLLSVASDDRSDKIDKSAEAVPTLASIDPSRVKKGATPNVTLTGKNFADGLKVHVNGRERGAVWASATNTSFKLEAEDTAKTGAIEVVVKNSKSAASTPLSLTVTD